MEELNKLKEEMETMKKRICFLDSSLTFNHPPIKRSLMYDELRDLRFSLFDKERKLKELKNFQIFKNENTKNKDSDKDEINFGY